MINIKNFKQFVNESVAGTEQSNGLVTDNPFPPRILAGKSPGAQRIAREIYDACRCFGADVMLLNMSADWDEEGFVKALRQITSRAKYQEVEQLLKSILRWTDEEVEGGDLTGMNDLIKKDPSADLISIISDKMFGMFDGDGDLGDEAGRIIGKYTTDKDSPYFGGEVQDC